MDSFRHLVIALPVTYLENKKKQRQFFKRFNVLTCCVALSVRDRTALCDNHFCFIAITTWCTGVFRRVRWRESPAVTLLTDCVMTKGTYETQNDNKHSCFVSLPNQGVCLI